MAEPLDNAHDILDRIGCPGKRNYDSAFDRISLAGDRLMLRPVGEPDTADLVGRINEICDRAGIADGETAWRVQVLADHCADLDAELAQLDAKPARLDVLPPPAFIESLRSLGVVGDVTVRVTH